jgi:uncharacterized protein YcbX
MSLSLSSIRIYPIKSLGGFAVEEARTTDRGFEHDRRWMLVDEEGRFITQREQPTMALLRCTASATGFRVTDARTGDTLDLPWWLDGSRTVDAAVFDDAVRVLEGEPAWSAWFTERLGASARLVFMPDSSQRSVDARYADGLTSLSDGFPYLVLSQASLDDLNARMEVALPMDRFRPNLVISGGTAYQEDAWREVRIGTVRFTPVKPCGRCAITTTDQRTGERGKEPLRTLATYRAWNGKVLFGMNAMAEQGGVVRVGDLVAP